MNNIKVLYILPTLQGGGAEKVVITLLKKINNKSHIQADLCVIKKKVHYQRYIENAGFNIFFLLNEKEKISLNILKVLNRLKKIAVHYDIIVGALELTATYLSYIVSNQLNKKHIAWIHTTISKYLENVSFRSIYRKLFYKIYPNIDNVVFPSYGALNDYMDLINSNNFKGKKVIYNPINIQEVENLSQYKKEVVKKPYILSIGRLSYEKGFDILIRVYNQVSNKFKDAPNLVILGEGPERKKLESLIKEYNLDRKVILAGFKENPYPYIKDAEFFVLPSRFEGFGVVLIEAMALGKAVVATDCPHGPGEILRFNKYGLLSTPENPYLLSEAILEMINNTRLRKTYEERSLIRSKEFDIENIAKEWEKYLREVYEV